jgi:poly-gamma-glutamate capsule biosynthesis protein CapA/YwtB (metallophosphatase superfamily)
MLSGADLVMVNLEGAIGDDEPADTTSASTPKCPGPTKRCYALRMPASAAPALRHLRDNGEVVANVANNHSRDAGAAGLVRTVGALRESGVYVTGADTLATPVVTPRGDTVAFLGFGSSGEPDARNLDAVRRHVSRAASRYPRLVVTMHVGAEGRDAQRTRDTMETYLDERRGNPVAFAHAAVDAGAALVVGHGPHVVRAMEWRRGALIAYSLGNLVTYGPFALRSPLDRGALLCATLDRRGAVSDARLVSTRQRAPGWVRADPTARAAALADSLSRLDFPETGAHVFVEATVRRP